MLFPRDSTGSRASSDQSGQKAGSDLHCSQADCRERRSDVGDVLGIWDNPTRSVPMLMFRSSSRVLIVALAGLSSFLASCASLDSAAGSRLDLVKARGELLCGVSGKIPGFSFLSPDGRYTGLDLSLIHI